MISTTKLQNPDGSRIDFSEISLESLGCHLMFGEVDNESMKAAISFVLKANHLFPNGELTLYINSVGGVCSDGFALIDLIDISRLPISTVSSGTIMSMGVLIACAGMKGKRIITRNTDIMAHQFTGGFEGKFHELMAASKALEYTAHQFTQHFLRHSQMSEAQIKDILFGPTDRWLTPQECKKYGLIDIIVDELPSPALPGHDSLDKQSKHRTQQQTANTGRRKKR